MPQPTPPPAPAPTVTCTSLSPPSSRPKCGAWRKVPAHKAKTILPDKTTPKVPCVRKGTVSTSVKVVKPPHRRYPCPDCGFVCDTVKNREIHRGSKRCRDLAQPDSPLEILTPPVVEDSSPVFRRRVQPIKPAILAALRSTPPQVLDERRESQVTTSSGSETTLDGSDGESEMVEQLVVPTLTVPSTEIQREAIVETPPLVKQFACGVCEEVFNTLDMLRTHRRSRRCFPDSLPASLVQVCDDFQCPDCTIEPVTSRFNGVFRSVTITPTEHCITADQLFNNTREGVFQILRFALANGEDLKVYSTTSVTFHKVNIADGVVDEEKTFFFSTKAAPIQTESNIDELVQRSNAKVSNQIDKFTNRVPTG